MSLQRPEVVRTMAFLLHPREANDRHSIRGCQFIKVRVIKSGVCSSCVYQKVKVFVHDLHLHHRVCPSPYVLGSRWGVSLLVHSPLVIRIGGQCQILSRWGCPRVGGLMHWAPALLALLFFTTVSSPVSRSLTEVADILSSGSLPVTVTITPSPLSPPRSPLSSDRALMHEVIIRGWCICNGRWVGRVSAQFSGGSHHLFRFLLELYRISRLF